jgi:hypothetical protein
MCVLIVRNGQLQVSYLDLYLSSLAPKVARLTLAWGPVLNEIRL